MKSTWILLVLAVLAAPANLHGQAVSIRNGFITGQNFRSFVESQRRAYVAGLVDGMLLAPLLGAPESGGQWLVRCIERMTDEQVAAIVSRYLDNHPERWHQSMHAIGYASLREVCT